MRTTHPTPAGLRRAGPIRAGLLLAGPLLAGLLLAACGDDSAFTSVSTSEGGSTSVSSQTTATTSPGACGYYDVAGCALYGLVLAAPLPTADALAAVAGLPGVPVAVWRSDFDCVLQANMGAPGPVLTEPSRFAYVDADGIRERRLATSGSVAPPITGIHISQSYWDRWEDQWAKAQEPGVLVEAVAVYLPETYLSGAPVAGPPPGFSAIVPVPWRRTDTLDPAAYSGELLLESEDFPAGYLSSPASRACS